MKIVQRNTTTYGAAWRFDKRAKRKDWPQWLRESDLVSRSVRKTRLIITDMLNGGAQVVRHGDIVVYDGDLDYLFTCTVADFNERYAVVEEPKGALEENFKAFIDVAIVDVHKPGAKNGVYHRPGWFRKWVEDNANKYHPDAYYVCFSSGVVVQFNPDDFSSTFAPLKDAG